jgi:acyl carrier protein
MAIGEAKVLVTTAAFYRRKVAEWRRELPGLEYVLLIDGDGAQSLDGTIDFNATMMQSSFELRLASTGPEDLALREELDIDSMDFLNLVTALSERLKIDIPETDYPRLATFGHAVDYLVQRLGVAT